MSGFWISWYCRILILSLFKLFYHARRFIFVRKPYSNHKWLISGFWGVRAFFFFSLSILLFLILTYWLGLCGIYYFCNLIRWLKFWNQNSCVKVLNVCWNSKYVAKSHKITLCSTEKQINRDSRRERNLFTSLMSLRKWSMLNKSQYRDFFISLNCLKFLDGSWSVCRSLARLLMLHYVRLSLEWLRLAEKKKLSWVTIHI